MAREKDRTYKPAVVTVWGRPAKLNPDARTLAGLTHPVRLQIWDILRFEGPATATSLAERLGVATGSTSWHLHKLAEQGFIEEIVDRRKGRQRWWRSAFGKVVIQYAEAMEAGPEQAEATTEHFVAAISHGMGRAARFLRQDWDFEWRYSAIFNSYDQLVLDPDTLEQMRTELSEVANRYMENPSKEPNAQRVILTMQGYPYRPDDQRGTPSTPTEPADDTETAAQRVATPPGSEPHSQRAGTDPAASQSTTGNRRRRSPSVVLAAGQAHSTTRTRSRRQARSRRRRPAE